MAAELGLGKLITGEAERDATHVAVVPVVAGVPLRPGQRVSFLLEPGHPETTAIPHGEIVAVIDPYLISVVKTGEKCWAFMLPGTIKGLRHDWTHPVFDTKIKAELEAAFHRREEEEVEREEEEDGCRDCTSAT